MIGLIFCEEKLLSKALMDKSGLAYVFCAFDTMSTLGMPIFLSVSSNQIDAYKTIFDPKKIIAVKGAIADEEHLHALLEVHIKYPAENILALSCSMPLIEMQLLERLCIVSKTHEEYDAYFFTNNDESEYLCGIYSSKVLASIMDLHLGMKSDRQMLEAIMRRQNCYFVPLEHNEKQYFKKFNND